MNEKITSSGDMGYIPFPIPGATSDKLFAKLLNTDTSSGPVVAELKMDPGAFIPLHYHEKTEEQFYVLEGIFINNGTPYQPGTFFTVQRGVSHGPHATDTGCRIIFIQPSEVDPSDFFIVQ